VGEAVRPSGSSMSSHTSSTSSTTVMAEMTFGACSNIKRQRVAPPSSFSCSPACRMLLVLIVELLAGEQANELDSAARI
jgi:hypothetical protein